MSKQLWHTKTLAEALALLGSAERGLTETEVVDRVAIYGPNKLPEGKRDRLLVIFLRQFQSPLIYVLFIAAILVFLLKEPVDAFIILAVLFFNAIVGTIQEGKAQNTLLALKKMTDTEALVLRDGQEKIIKDSEVVPGDIIVLTEGSKVPADARLISANTLKVDEASLTGESESTEKNTETASAKDLVLADQKNMVFKGTNVVSGNGLAVVVATGLETEIGQIASKISTIDSDIPLKTNIDYLSRLIVVVVLTISIVIGGLGLWSGESIKQMFLTVVALAISLIPEGLPVVMTLVLATGVWRMSRRNVLVKRLQAVEALGQTKIIAVDKTGTLTRNEMVVERVYAGGKMFTITGTGYYPKGEVIVDGQAVEFLNHPELVLAARVASFGSGARVSFLESNNSWKVSGDPTDAAMTVLSEKLGFRRDLIDQENPKIFELPFDYRRKYHAVVRQYGGTNFLALAGAPENVLDLCGGTKAHEEKVFHELAGAGFRVVALAIKENVDDVVDPDKMPTLSFVGFLGIRDALRSEVVSAVLQVKEALMKVVMITGDHRLTAVAIAREAGIFQDGDAVLTGEEINQLSDSVLAEKLAKVSVFARVTPDHKFRIIRAYQARGEVVAMTGDGVNDAPPLVAADLGVAMGKIGTEVAKEAADIILLDDNFASIVAAAEEGRNIYKTIKKVILYLFSTSVGEALIIGGAIVLGFPLPLLPAQIIWLNLVTDGFLDVALAMEPKEKGLLKSRFEKPKKWIVDGLMTQRIFLMAITMTVGTLYLFSQNIDFGLAKALTLSLTTMAVFQWFNAWNCRSEDKSIFQINPFSNKFLVGATVIVIGLQFFALHNPFMQKILSTQPISLKEWLVILAIGSSILVVEEIRKLFHRFFRPSVV